MRSDLGGAGATASAGDNASDTVPTAGSDKGRPSSAPRREGFLARHKGAATSLLLGAVVFGFIYYVLPQIVGLSATLQRLRNGNPWWLGLAIPLEALSMAAYIVLFRGVFSPSDRRVGWTASYQITMAGGAAAKLFAAAGSGGVALTVWALRASGLASATVAQEMVCFEIVNYAVYMLALVICGFGLWIGLFAGSAPLWRTLVPALFGLVVISLVLSMKWLASPAERLMLKREERSHKRAARWWHRAASVPRALQDGLAAARELVRAPTARGWADFQISAKIGRFLEHVRDSTILAEGDARHRHFPLHYISELDPSAWFSRVPKAALLSPHKVEPYLPGFA